MTTSAVELVAHDVSYRVGGRAVLDRVSLRARPGELLVVSGPSGSGKSTLLALLAGLESPSEGRVSIEGRPAGEPSGQLAAGIGVVLQGYGLVSALTAAENVSVVLQARREPRARIREITADALDLVGLRAQADHLVDQLSGGQQQRVALARALAGQPFLLLADEPTAELDADTRTKVIGLLLAQAARGAIVVVASHDPEVVGAGDREVALDSGRIASAADAS